MIRWRWWQAMAGGHGGPDSPSPTGTQGKTSDPRSTGQGERRPPASAHARHRAWWFLVPGVAFIALVAWAAFPTLGGQEFLLATEPLDPPDPLRGDHVELRYAISSIDLAGRPAPEVGDRIHVALAPSDRTEPGTGQPYWQPTGWSKDSPGGACLRGRVVSVDADRMEVRYGIEQFFIPKDEDLSDWQGREVSVLVSERACTGRVVEVHLDGVRWRP